MQDIRRSDESGTHLAAIVSNHLCQCIRCFLTVFCQSRLNRQNMFRLCPVLRICVSESLHDFFMKCLVRLHIFPDHTSCLYYKFCRMCIKCRRNKIFSAWSLIASLRRIQTEPVTEVFSPCPQIWGGCVICHIIHPFFHTGKLIF